MNPFRRSLAICALAIGASNVMADPDTTPCETAYDTTSGTAVCGGVNVNVFDLLCGNGFVQQTCVAKWTNGGGDEEWYFFMGAGAGISGSQLPSDCSTLPDGLAMVQYYPNKDGCFPAADLNGGGGTQMYYTASSDEDNTLASVTISFVEHDDGTATRNGYIKVSCSATDQGFTTKGDSNQPSFYEIDAVAPCSGAPAPGPPGPNGPSHNSGDEEEGGAGGILLIVFFCSLIVYFTGGVAYNWKVKNLEGKERVPNLEFWTGLPGLIKEGFRFTIAKIKRDDGYSPL